MTGAMYDTLTLDEIKATLEVDGRTLGQLEAELTALDRQFKEMVQNVDEQSEANALLFITENMPRIQKLLGDKQRFAADYKLLEQLNHIYAQARAAKDAVKTAQHLAEEAQGLFLNLQRYIGSLLSQTSPSSSIIEAARKRLPTEILSEYENTLR
ncbi:MAG: hypothetical protein K8I82_08500 [Anaerolineae bacterium]|nr:hypothetical protein [Anaerolineae bacterium]